MPCRYLTSCRCIFPTPALLAGLDTKRMRTLRDLRAPADHRSHACRTGGDGRGATGKARAVPPPR